MISFDLLVPVNGGTSHLRAPGTAGFLCGANTGRRAFNMLGIVDSHAGSCMSCRIAAQGIEARAAR